MRLRIAAFEMMTETDARGHYSTTKHCTLSFHFGDVRNVRITSDGPAGAIIFGMQLEDGPDGSIAVWGSSVGIEGAFTAGACLVAVEPRERNGSP